MKLDITSTVIEKGFDLAKEFLGKLIGPTVEETGLLLKDHVTFWRLKTQIKILNRTKEFCLKNNISIKSISLKVLCPLLENASLEEDEFLQEKWSILLSNMVDSEQNIENHVLPFLLSQISKPEFIEIENTFAIYQERITKLNKELNQFNSEVSSNEAELRRQISQIPFPTEDSELLRARWKLDAELDSIIKVRGKFHRQMKLREDVKATNLKDFELSNLLRLGVIKAIQKNTAYSNSYRIKNTPNADYLYVEDLEIEIDPDGEVYILSELGELFAKACTEKGSSNLNK